MRIADTLDLTWDAITKPAHELSVGDSRFRARLLSALLLATIFFSLLGMWFSLRVEGSVQSGLPLTTAILLVAYILSRTRAYSVAAALTLVALGVPPVAAVIGEADYSSGAIAVDLLWLMLPMLLAGLLLSVKGVLIASALVLIVVSALPLFIPELVFSHVAFMLGFFCTVSVLIALSASVRRRYVNEVHRQFQRQKDVERELLRLKEFSENIISNMAEGIVVQDADGHFSFVNPAAAVMLGYSPEELMGMHWTEIIPPKYHAHVEAVDERRVKGETSRYEVELLRKDGTRLPVMVSGSPRRDTEGAFLGTLAVFTNIGERKRAEEKLRQLNEELEERVARRTAELVAANKRLEELDRLKTKFIADMSHELRTPTMNIRLYLALLKDGDPAKSERHLTTLEEEVERLSTIVKSIFDVAYLEKGRSELPLGVVDVNGLVRKAEMKFRPRIEAAGLELHVSLGEDLPAVMGARSQIAQAIDHLVENAVKYTTEGAIHLRTEDNTGDERVGVIVRDTGIGIPEEELPHLFSRFYRTRRVGQSTIPGAGVGLAVVKEIAELHGGDVTVKSQEGGGSTFGLWLPAQTSP